MRKMRDVWKEYKSRRHCRATRWVTQRLGEESGAMEVKEMGREDGGKEFVKDDGGKGRREGENGKLMCKGTG